MRGVLMISFCSSASPGDSREREGIIVLLALTLPFLVLNFISKKIPLVIVELG